MVTRIAWSIRPATEEDIDGIVTASWKAADLVHPYCLGPAQVKGYLDQWVVVTEEDKTEVVGYIHYLRVKENDQVSKDNVYAYLRHIKIVPENVIQDFVNLGSKAVFIGQTMGPPKTGIQKLVVDYLKDTLEVDEIWHGLSVVSPLFEYYEDKCGITWGTLYKFFNPFKGDYSTFKLGKWIRSSDGN